MNDPSEVLFEPMRLGGLTLSNRMVMAPMTRSRADHATHLPTPIMEDYYEQRASAGLIISEGVIISPRANGYINIPGLFDAAQVEAWKKITQKVHAKGGRIFAQLWHVGRISHPDLLDGQAPLAPSAINPRFSAFTLEGPKDTVTPAAMSLADIAQTIEDFHLAARNAIAAGFDGVEIHGANGYLIHQFLTASANTRTDAYGGDVQGRSRFLFEVLAAVSAAIGSHRVGLRLNPGMTGVAGIVRDAQTDATFDAVIARLDACALAYLHLTGAFEAGDDPAARIIATARAYREVFKGVLIVNNGLDKRSGGQAIADGVADLVAYGAPFIANPDLVLRYRDDLPLNTPDPATFYAAHDVEGYTDYPFATA
jgi:N-ethylmaleimide reductase